MSAGPLSGVRIADFTWIGAGSYTTKLLADFGADVIKIETSRHMDTLRSTGPFKDGISGINRSGYFADRNTSKRSININLKHPAGTEIGRRLVACSDIVANNFRPGVMDRLGFGYESLKLEYPKLIYLAMAMQGAAGPDAEYVGFGLTIGALTGLHNLCGPKDCAPVGTGTNYPDHVPNPTHAAFAVLAALHFRNRTGRGQYIDLAQTEPTVALQGTAMIDYTVNRRIAERCGNDHPNAVPHGVYPCRGEDRWIAIAAHDDVQWAGLAAALELAPETTLKWSQALIRNAARDEISNWLVSVTRERDAYELMQLLQTHGVPSGVVQNARDLIKSDPQLAHRRHWQTLEHPEMGATLYNGLPIHLSRTPGKLSRPAPLLGQHTEEVCIDLLGFTRAQYIQFEEEGAFE